MQAQIQAEEAERMRLAAEAEILARQDAETALSSVAGKQAARLSAAQQNAAKLAREEAELVERLLFGELRREGGDIHAVDGVVRVGDIADGAHAEHRVHLGHIPQDIAAVSLRETAGDDDGAEVFVLLEPRHVENVVDRFRLCAFDEGAGVYYHHVSFALVGDKLITRLHGAVEHDLRVHEVFRAAERNEADLYLFVFQYRFPFDCFYDAAGCAGRAGRASNRTAYRRHLPAPPARFIRRIPSSSPQKSR